MRIKEEDYKGYTLVFCDRMQLGYLKEYCIAILNPLAREIAVVVDPTSLDNARKKAIKIVSRRRGDSLDDYTRSKIRDLSISKPHLFEKINLNDYIKGGRLEDSDRERLTDWGDLGWITIDEDEVDQTYRFRWEDIENY